MATTDKNCAYCDKPQPSEFDRWLAAVDAHLADIDESRAQMPFQLHQWWELWDHCVAPQDAANAAWLLQPGKNAPWPEHVAYSTN